MELRYTPLERLNIPRPVDRLDYVCSTCRNRNVLDLGAMDETAYKLKQGQGTWLHERLASVAKSVVGVDSSPAVPEAGLPTAPNARIVRGDINDLDSLLSEVAFKPDVVVAGELIEHLANPLAFLERFVESRRLRGRELVVTTPNATAAHNVVIGLSSRESTHRDHLCILSYKTLNTLFSRAGFVHWEIIPYRSRFIEMRARNVGLLGTLVAAGEKTINAVEWAFPLLSFGWIVRASV